MTELKPCPFCGGEARLSELPAVEPSARWHVHCGNDECEVEPFLWRGTKEKAIEAWNARADDRSEAAAYWQRMYEETVRERTCHADREEHESPFDGKLIVMWRCSECEDMLLPSMNYCPNCGAKVVDA